MDDNRSVVLLVDGSNESKTAKEIAREFDSRIQVEIYNARGDFVPLALWNGSDYQGVDGLKLLKTTLNTNLNEGRI